MMGMRKTWWVAGLLALASTSVSAQKGKPAPPPDAVSWRCDVVMRDAEGDAIKSDEARTGVPGQTYVDGVGGFTCAMSTMESAQAGNPTPGSATFYFGRKPMRGFVMPVRTGADGTWSGGFDTGLQIRIFNLVDMPLGVQARAMAIPTSLIGAMYADAGGAVADLVKVVRVDACTWQISFDPYVPADAESLPDQGLARVERYTSLDRRTLLGTPSLPLGFTLTTRAADGGSGCPSVP